MEGEMQKVFTTKTAGFEYSVSGPWAETLNDVRELYSESGIDPEEALLRAWQFAQSQAVQQGPKRGVLVAVQEAKEAGDDPESSGAVAEAVVEAQKEAEAILYGTGPKRDGFTKEKKAEIGGKIAETIKAKAITDPEGARELAQMLDLDPAVLGL